MFRFIGHNCETPGNACYQGVCGEGRCGQSAKGAMVCYCPFGKNGLRCERELIIIEPAFTDGSYAVYPTPKDALRRMQLLLKIKPRDLADGLILYSAQSYDGRGDFTSIAVKNKTIEFQFDTGSGPAIIRSKEMLQPNEWLEIIAERTMKQGSLLVTI